MMIKCSECGKKFSDNASACPHCGCPISVQKPITPKKKMDPKEKKKTIIVAVIAIVVVGGVWIFLTAWNKSVEEAGKKAFENELYNNGGTPITSVAKDFDVWANNH